MLVISNSTLFVLFSIVSVAVEEINVRSVGVSSVTSVGTSSAVDNISGSITWSLFSWLYTTLTQPRSINKNNASNKVRSIVEVINSRNVHTRRSITLTRRFSLAQRKDVLLRLAEEVFISGLHSQKYGIQIYYLRTMTSIVFLSVYHFLADFWV